MQTSQLPPWDLYVKLLYPLQRGYPLWDTAIDCGNTQNGPCNSPIGMVGFLKNGKFRLLIHPDSGEGAGSDGNFTPLEGLKRVSNPRLTVRWDREVPREYVSFDTGSGFVGHVPR